VRDERVVFRGDERRIGDSMFVGSVRYYGE